ncbi:hypothetical protein BC835DRAFT_1359476 [Cytidiella melzeri]|nr:hypothetical protein BC835DRAFT_1359476 [Cytidiella melzeri]
MRSDFAVALALLAIVGPAVSGPVASPLVSSDAPSNNSSAAASQNNVDDSSATQLLPALTFNSQLSSGKSVDLLPRGELASGSKPDPIEEAKRAKDRLMIGLRTAREQHITRLQRFEQEQAEAEAECRRLVEYHGRSPMTEGICKQIKLTLFNRQNGLRLEGGHTLHSISAEIAKLDAYIDQQAH